MPLRASSATGRAQRASARNQTATALPTEPASSADIASGSGAQPIVLDAEPSGSATGDDEPTLSRSNSTSNLQELMMPHTTHLKEGKQDKGKGKEVGTSTPPLRVKEEPKAVALPTPEPSNLVRPLVPLDVKLPSLTPCGRIAGEQQRPLLLVSIEWCTRILRRLPEGFSLMVP